MSLTRYLPLPSDRMGIIWNLLTISDGIVLEYGPAGTTHFSMSLFGELGADKENRLFTTHISEEDVVMGDVKRLENALVELDETYHPKVIFVVASSIVAVIGTDMKGVCRYMQERVKARLVPFLQGGFRGDYSLGCAQVWETLADEFAEPNVEKEANTCNLLGVSIGSYRERSNVWELKSLLDEAYGMKCSAMLCEESSLGQLEHLGSASLNLVLRQEAIPAARLLEKRCGTPYVEGIPFGYAKTLEWLQEVGERIGKPLNPQLETRLREKAGNAMVYRMNIRMLKQDTASATVVGEYQTVTGYAAFLESLGFRVEHKICLHSMKNLEHADESVLHLASEKERLDIMKSLHRQLVLGDDSSLRCCPEDNVKYRICMPVIAGAQIANHLPLAGERGADALLEKIEEYFQMVN